MLVELDSISPQSSGWNLNNIWVGTPPYLEHDSPSKGEDFFDWLPKTLARVDTHSGLNSSLRRANPQAMDDFSSFGKLLEAKGGLLQKRLKNEAWERYVCVYTEKVYYFNIPYFFGGHIGYI